MKKIKLHWWILLGILVGVGWGAWLNQAYYERYDQEARLELLGENPSEGEVTAAIKEIQEAVDHKFKTETFLGSLAHGIAGLFLALLKMIVIPLVFSSLISGVAGMGDMGALGRVGGKTGLWYVTTSMLAILTGLVIVNVLRPGVGVELPLPVGVTPPTPPDSVWDFLLTMVPENIVSSAADFQMLPVVFFSVMFGIFLLAVPAESRNPVARFFQGFFDVMMKMTMFIISMAPVGIAALIAKLVASTGPGVFASLAWYAIAVAVGLAFHLLVTLPALFWLITRRNPYLVMQVMSPVLMTAFSTASSSGTYPMTLARIEKKVGVSNKVSSFVLPLGATVNMDGTALYECVASIFVAQMYAAANPDFTLTLGTQATIVFLALMVSIGAAGIPHAGLVMMVIIFQAIGLPVELTALLWAVDRPLDMFRTMVNVWSDSMGTATIAHTEGAIDESVLFKRAA